jgi:hypothetical protein
MTYDLAQLVFVKLCRYIKQEYKLDSRLGQGLVL